VKDYVLDANAVLRHLNVGRGSGGEPVQDLLLQAQRGQARLLMSVINLGEVLYVLIRNIGEQRALEIVRALEHAVTIVEADMSLTIQAATIKHRYKLGYADGFAAALALDRKATLVSADPSFESMGKTLKWMTLPKHEAKRR
jgi:predicted nucleic acid-binding protein